MFHVMHFHCAKSHICECDDEACDKCLSSALPFQSLIEIEFKSFIEYLNNDFTQRDIWID